MGIATEEEQDKRGNILGGLVLATLLAIPIVNMLAGFVLVFHWGSKILMKSSNVLKDLSLFTAFGLGVGLAAYYGLVQIANCKS